MTVPFQALPQMAAAATIVGSPMKKSDFHRSNRTPIQCMQAIDLYVKTTKRAMLTLSFLAEKIKIKEIYGGGANY